MNFKFSPESIGGGEEKKDYQRHGTHVIKLGCPRWDRKKRYKKCLIPPALGWYPSNTANFVFKDLDYAPEILIDLAAETEWNPAVWLHAKTKQYVVRVPKDRKKEVWRRLYKKGLWYDPATNLWNQRRKRSRQFGYPSFIRSFSAFNETKGEKACLSKKDQARKLSVKILRQK